MFKKKHILFIFSLIFIFTGCSKKQATDSDKVVSTEKKLTDPTPPAQVDSATYNKKLLSLANGDTTGFWPIKTKIYPPAGAILPFKRIVAYYGNLYSKKMGILGEYAPTEVWKRLDKEVKAWEKADPTTPVQPAIHYIAVVAQGIPMSDNTYCKRMPDQQIDSALSIAKMGNAIVFLDIQIAKSSLKKEVPLLEKYLRLPNVHLGIDPEFSMKDGSVPGRKIGTMNADDINYCIAYLSELAKSNNLPPKILVVHRFTQGMVKEYRNIKLRPEVQVVMNMDGWGEPVLKFSTYNRYIYREPVQFTGFKLFYKNDLKKAPNRMLTPPELLKLKPQPIYIQYQ